MKKINFLKITHIDLLKIFKKIPYFLAENIFAVILFFLLLSFFLGGVLFYNFIYIQKNQETKIDQSLLDFFREDNLKNLLDKQEKIQERFNTSFNVLYSDPFIYEKIEIK